MEPFFPTRPEKEDDVDGVRPGLDMFRSARGDSSIQKRSQIEEEYVGPYQESYSSIAADHFRYKMKNRFRGYAIIINNQEFDISTGMGNRPGSERDREALIQVCSHIGFKGEDIIVRDNQTVEEMKRIVEYYAESEENKEADCIMLFILSHGDTNDVVFGRDAATTLPDIIRPIKKSDTLVGKPKMIFVQACRGENLDPGRYILSDELQTKDKKVKKYKISTESDLFYGYSTVQGYYSWRNQQNGSWFIQAFRDVFMEDGRQLELNALMARVARMVSYQFESNASTFAMTKKKQSPFFTSTLTKEVYFG